MTTLLLSVIAAASLMATGVGATSETRSAQSLPVVNLAVAQAPAAISGKLQPANHLTDAASAESGEGACTRRGGHWDAEKLVCRRGGAWFGPAGIIAGAAVVGGIVVAATSGGSNPVSN
jgi:hypothetical protein